MIRATGLCTFRKILETRKAAVQRRETQRGRSPEGEQVAVRETVSQNFSLRPLVQHYLSDTSRHTSARRTRQEGLETNNDSNRSCRLPFESYESPSPPSMQSCIPNQVQVNRLLLQKESSKGREESLIILLLRKRGVWPGSDANPTQSRLKYSGGVLRISATSTIWKRPLKLTEVAPDAHRGAVGLPSSTVKWCSYTTKDRTLN